MYARVHDLCMLDAVCMQNLSAVVQRAYLPCILFSRSSGSVWTGKVDRSEPKQHGQHLVARHRCGPEDVRGCVLFPQYQGMKPADTPDVARTPSLYVQGHRAEETATMKVST